MILFMRFPFFEMQDAHGAFIHRWNHYQIKIDWMLAWREAHFGRRRCRRVNEGIGQEMDQLSRKKRKRAKGNASRYSQQQQQNGDQGQIWLCAEWKTGVALTMFMRRFEDPLAVDVLRKVDVRLRCCRLNYIGNAEDKMGMLMRVTRCGCCAPTHQRQHKCKENGVRRQNALLPGLNPYVVRLKALRAHEAEIILFPVRTGKLQIRRQRLRLLFIPRPSFAAADVTSWRGCPDRGSTAPPPPRQAARSRMPPGSAPTGCRRW